MVYFKLVVSNRQRVRLISKLTVHEKAVKQHAYMLL